MMIRTLSRRFGIACGIAILLTIVGRLTSASHWTSFLEAPGWTTAFSASWFVARHVPADSLPYNLILNAIYWTVNVICWAIVIVVSWETVRFGLHIAQKGPHKRA